MDVSLLHKKLQPNWSAGTVSKSISTQASLNSIQLGFDKLEMKTKMRVLLSLLNFDVKAKADCMTSIRELLKLAADETKHGKWLPIIAGLVNDRLIGSKECSEEENEGGAYYHLEEAAHKIVQQLSRKDVAARAEHSLSFQPLELKYFIPSSCITTNLDGMNVEGIFKSADTESNGYDGYFKPHFTYCGEVPDLITKASKSLEDRQITDQKNKNMPAIGKNRDIVRTLGSVNDVHGSNSSIGMGSSTLTNARARSSLIHRPSGTSAFYNSGQRQSSKMTELDSQMTQSAQSAALSGSSATVEGLGSLFHKRKLISGASDTSAANKARPRIGEKIEKELSGATADPMAGSSSSLLKKKENVNKEVTTIPVDSEPSSSHSVKTEAAVATNSKLFEANILSSTVSNSRGSKDSLGQQTEVAPTVREAAGAVTQRIFTPFKEEMNVKSSISSSALSIPSSVPVPILGSSATVGPTVVSAGMDIETLFLSSPLLTPEDRTTITQFFSETWPETFTPSFRAANPVLKIKLRSDEKIGADGQRIKETVNLHLEFSPHSWKKILKKNKIGSKVST